MFAAYERSNPVNNMEVDPAVCNTVRCCNTNRSIWQNDTSSERRGSLFCYVFAMQVHIVVGDAGNDETLEVRPEPGSAILMHTRQRDMLERP